jgi:hypothetical protein
MRIKHLVMAVSILLVGDSLILVLCCSVRSIVLANWVVTPLVNDESRASVSILPSFLSTWRFVAGGVGLSP